MVELLANASSYACPVCQMPAERIHSHYGRTVADLPWADFVVSLHLHVRTFFCDNATCPRKIFTERLPTVVAPSARRSVRLAQHQQELGLALGGNPSARLSADLGCGTSRNTFLRLIRRLPLPEPPVPPDVIGIDDWAWRKGQRYGTIIIDLERHCPIALLEDRDAQTLADWLRQYPALPALWRAIARVSMPRRPARVRPRPPRSLTASICCRTWLTHSCRSWNSMARLCARQRAPVHPMNHRQMPSTGRHGQ